MSSSSSPGAQAVQESASTPRCPCRSTPGPSRAARRRGRKGARCRRRYLAIISSGSTRCPWTWTIWSRREAPCPGSAVLEGLVVVQVALVAQGLDEEARVQRGAGWRARCRRLYWSTGIQYATSRGSKGRVILAGREVAREIPGRLDEGVHCFLSGLAPRGLSAFGTCHVDEALARGQRRAPVGVDLDVRGSSHGQVLHGARARCRRTVAVDDGMGAPQ